MKKNRSKRTRILGNFGWLTNVNDHRQHEFDKKWKTCVEMILDSLDSFKAIKKKNNFFVHSRYYYETLRTINFIKIISKKKNKQPTKATTSLHFLMKACTFVLLIMWCIHTKMTSMWTHPMWRRVWLSSPTHQLHGVHSREAVPICSVIGYCQ